MRSPFVSNADFFGVSGTSSTDAWAVGVTQRFELLAEHWDGSTWSDVSPLGQGGLSAVAAIAPDDVWAVGNDVRRKTLAEHWDGTAWTAVHTPTPGGTGTLYALSALSSVDVWAAGQHTSSDGTIQPLFLHWDGVAWRVKPAPHGTRLSGGIMFGIHALSPTDVWAVGYKGTPSIVEYLPLAEHWDGAKWRIVKVPPPSDRGANLLRAVSGVSSDDVWAVGSQSDGHFIEHWDGTSWTLVQDDPLGPLLLGVAAASTDDVWAVGGAESADVYALIEHWDGTSWTKVPSPTAGVGSDLRAAIAITPTDVWAVGSYYPESTNEGSPLTEHYSGPCP